MKKQRLPSRMSANSARPADNCAQLSSAARELEISTKIATNCTSNKKICYRKGQTLDNASSHLERKHIMFQILHFKPIYFISAASHSGPS